MSIRNFGLVRFIVTVFAIGFLPVSASSYTPAETNKNEGLLRAAREGSLKEVNTLLNSGANIITTDSVHFTALILAVKGGHVRVAKLLLDKGAGKRADVGPRRFALSSALTERQGNLEMVKLLREWGFKPFGPVYLKANYVKIPPASGPVPMGQPVLPH